MDKVLLVLPDNNKGKFITKGFSSAFKDSSFFVIEKKIYDLNTDEINRILPDIIFIFWSDIKQTNVLKDIFGLYNNKKTVFINYAELLTDIPDMFYEKENSYCFSCDNKDKRYKISLAIMPKDYKRKFTGYKYNITFAGNPSYKNRELILSKLVYNFGIINIFCRSYDFYKSVDDIYRDNLLNSKFIDLYRESYRGYVDTQKELSYIYSSTKVNIDILNPEKDSLSYRCLEAAVSGGFMIAPYSDALTYNMENGKDIETYKEDFELIDKVRFYLNNLNLAQLIALKGKKNTVSNHSFYDRLKVMLKEIYGKNTGN